MYSKNPREKYPKLISVVNVLFHRMHHGSKRTKRKKNVGKFTQKEFRLWCYSNGIEDIYSKWVESGYIKGMKPSIDRINPLKGYVFSNMRVTTQRDNFEKGYNIDIPITQGRRIVQLDRDGKFVDSFISVMCCEKAGFGAEENIRKVAEGSRLLAMDFRWKYLDECEGNSFKKGIAVIDKKISELLSQYKKKLADEFDK